MVDDTEDSARSLSEIVRVMGHPATYVTDPRVAVEAAIGFAPDVVLLDIGMPHINGYDLAPMLRRALDNPALTVVALTAGESEQAKSYSHAIGFDAHLVKPAKREDIEAVIVSRA